MLLKGPTAHYDKTQGQLFDEELHSDLMQQIGQAIKARLPIEAAASRAGQGGR